MGKTNDRRNFLKGFFTVAGVSLLPGSVTLAAENLKPAKTVEFITRFPAKISLQEYRLFKSGFENQDKVVTLVSTFKKSKRMLEEKFSFHETYCVWRVTFDSHESYQDWMNLTEDLDSHSDKRRQDAGFSLEIRTLS